MALTKKKRAFIAAYVEDPKLGQADAARRAGCSVKRAKVTGYEWMRDPEVKLEIQRQLANKLGRIDGQAAKRELTADGVIQELDDIAEMCRLAGAGAWQAATLVKVAELKGKYLKMWTERIEFGMDEKLIERLEAGRKRAAGIALPAPQPQTEISAPASGTREKPHREPRQQKKKKRSGRKKKRSA